MDAFDVEETLFVVAHELGHYVRRDPWLGIALGTVALATMLIFADAALRRTTTRGVTSPAQGARFAFTPCSRSSRWTPLMNAASRAMERRADRFALEATGDREAGIRAFRRLGEQNLAELEPRAGPSCCWPHTSLAARIRALEEAAPPDPLGRDDERYFAQAMHQPLGLILPVTTLHLLGLTNSLQPAHFRPCGPGLSWYLNCFLLSAACAADSVAPTASAAKGMAAMRRSTRPRETGFTATPSYAPRMRRRYESIRCAPAPALSSARASSHRTKGAVARIASRKTANGPRSSSFAVGDVAPHEVVAGANQPEPRMHLGEAARRDAQRLGIEREVRLQRLRGENAVERTRGGAVGRERAAQRLERGLHRNVDAGRDVGVAGREVDVVTGERAVLPARRHPRGEPRLVGVAPLVEARVVGDPERARARVDVREPVVDLCPGEQQHRDEVFPAVPHVLVPRLTVGVEPRPVVVLLQPPQKPERNPQVERIGLLGQAGVFQVSERAGTRRPGLRIPGTSCMPAPGLAAIAVLVLIASVRAGSDACLALRDSGHATALWAPRSR